MRAFLKPYQAHLGKSALESAGIECEIRGDEMQAWPGALPQLSLWVPAADAERAGDTLDAIEDAEEGPEWNCARCREANPGTFDSCWSCGAQRGEVPAGLRDDLSPPAGRLPEAPAASRAEAHPRRHGVSWAALLFVAVVCCVGGYAAGHYGLLVGEDELVVPSGQNCSRALDPTTKKPTFEWCDQNRDGHSEISRWFHPDGTLSSEAVDDNRNGIPETGGEFNRAGQRIFGWTDANENRVYEEATRFRGGRVTATLVDANEDGAWESYKEFYKDGSVVQWFDRNADDHYETRTWTSPDGKHVVPQRDEGASGVVPALRPDPSPTPGGQLVP